MATLYWKRMEADVWTFLNSKSTYTDLGLREFRGYLGDMLPFDPEEGRFPDDAVPAIASDADLIETRPFTEIAVEDVVPIRFSVVYGTTSSTTARDSVEAAASAITDILVAKNAVRTNMNSANINSFEFNNKGFFPHLDDGGGEPRYWEWSFDLVLIGNRRTVI